jgi:hypothetical protein
MSTLVSVAVASLPRLSCVSRIHPRRSVTSVDNTKASSVNLVYLLIYLILPSTHGLHQSHYHKTMLTTDAQVPSKHRVLGPCSRYRARQSTSRRHRAALQCDSGPKAEPALAPPSAATATAQSCYERGPPSVGDGLLTAASRRQTKADRKLV